MGGTAVQIRIRWRGGTASPSRMGWVAGIAVSHRVLRGQRRAHEGSDGLRRLEGGESAHDHAARGRVALEAAKLQHLLQRMIDFRFRLIFAFTGCI